MFWLALCFAVAVVHPFELSSRKITSIWGDIVLSWALRAFLTLLFEFSQLYFNLSKTRALASCTGSYVTCIARPHKHMSTLFSNGVSNIISTMTAVGLFFLGCELHPEGLCFCCCGFRGACKRGVALNLSASETCLPSPAIPSTFLARPVNVVDQLFQCAGQCSRPSPFIPKLRVGHTSSLQSLSTRDSCLPCPCIRRSTTSL